MSERIENWKKQVRHLKQETYALFLAYRDPRTPWYARIFAACVVAYAFSPIDLIPDFVPVLGYLDDLVLVPLGISIAIRLIPGVVLDDCRQQARARLSQDKPTNWVAAGVIVFVWLGLAAGSAWLAARAFGWLK